VTGRGVNGQPRHRRQEWSAGDRALAAGRRPGAADLAEGNGDAARFRSPWLLAAHRVPPSMIRVLDFDLAAAGIARVDERGRTVDIHALRRTFASHRWAREGKGPRGPERRKCRERRKNRGSAATPTRAGEGTRTLDIQLGNRQGQSSKCSRRSTYVEPFRPLYRWLYLRQPWGPRAASLTACRLLDARSRVDGADRGLGLPAPSHPGRHPRHGEGLWWLSPGGRRTMRTMESRPFEFLVS